MSRFVPDQAGIRQLSRQASMAVPLMARARIIAEGARELCPSRRVAAEIKAEGPGIDARGVFARVNAHHWTSVFVEFGTITQPPAAMLRRAAERGGKFIGRAS